MNWELCITFLIGFLFGAGVVLLSLVLGMLGEPKYAEPKDSLPEIKAARAARFREQLRILSGEELV